jgi:hypothetical protein
MSIFLAASSAARKTVATLHIQRVLARDVSNFIAVRLIPSKLSAEQFRTQMESYGQVRQVVLKPMTNDKWAYGVVEYKDPDDAFAAVDDLHGNVLYGRRVTVEFAHSWWNNYSMANASWVRQDKHAPRKGAAAEKVAPAKGSKQANPNQKKIADLYSKKGKKTIAVAASTESEEESEEDEDEEGEKDEEEGSAAVESADGEAGADVAKERGKFAAAAAYAAAEADAAAEEGEDNDGGDGEGETEGGGEGSDSDSSSEEEEEEKEEGRKSA